MYFTACPNAKELINKQKSPTFILVKQAKSSAYKPHVDGIAQYQQHISQSQSNYRHKRIICYKNEKNTLHSITIARYSNKTGEKSCTLIAIKMVTLQMATTKAMSITIDNAKPKLQ